MNSKLAVMGLHSPNFSKRKTIKGYGDGKIDTITPHIVVGNLSLFNILNIFTKKSRRASCTYAIDSKGLIGSGLSETLRPWTSSSRLNDNRAITVEIANKKGKGYPITDKAMNGFIDLCVDILTRYGKDELYYDPVKSKRHRGGNTMRITLHRWFKNKSCPGDYVVSKLPYICSEVTRRLRGPVEDVYPYLVRIKVKGLNIRREAGIRYPVVGLIKPGVYTIVDAVDSYGTMWYKLKSGVGWISSKYADKI